MVPMPAVCLSGIQQNNTSKLIMKVANPILQPVTFVIPWANTVHGLTPTPAAIIKASPRPKRIRPIKRKTIDASGGDIVSAFGELQNSFGTPFTDRNLSFSPTSFVPNWFTKACASHSRASIMGCQAQRIAGLIHTALSFIWMWVEESAPFGKYYRERHSICRDLQPHRQPIW